MLEKLSPIVIDPIFKLWTEFVEDKHPKKQNLGIGIYSDEQGSSYVMPSIQKAAKEIQTDNFDYVSMNGNRSFLRNTAKLILGDTFNENQTALQQTCGGTQALKFVADICKKSGYKKALFPSPTWQNHYTLFKNFDQEKFDHITVDHTVDIESYKEALKNSDNQTVLVIQGGQSHNPCGINLSLTQIQELLPLIREKNIFVCVDFAYLGFGENIEKDLETTQLLWEQLEHVTITFSYSKSACLYKQRTGALLIKTPDPHKIESHLQVLVRESISNPPAFGADIMNLILSTNIDQWKGELETMEQSIQKRKDSLLALLPEKYQYLHTCRGMFGLLSLTSNQIEALRHDYGIYFPDDGRINFSGLQTENISYVADALAKVTE